METAWERMAGNDAPSWYLHPLVARQNFCAQVAELGLLQSASVRGPGDNAHAESFFHSLKAELTRGVAFPTDRALNRALKKYMRYYNATRLHSSLNYLSPLAFEQCAA